MKKTIDQSSEDQIIEQLIAAHVTGIGDDCALVADKLLISTDSFVEDVHFNRQMPSHLVGQKVVRATISDIYASGGKPKWLTLAASFPKNTESDWLQGFTCGVADATRDFDVHWVGGDTTSSMDRIFINATVLGPLIGQAPVLRCGARAGDMILVTGVLGESALALQDNLRSAKPGRDLRQHCLRPLARDFVEAIVPTHTITAMMDLSDGLVQDLCRLCEASDLGASVDLRQVPTPSGLDSKEQEISWIGGEDFELLFTINPKDFAKVNEIAARVGQDLNCIGVMESEDKVRYHLKGKPYGFKRSPWSHFA